VSTVVIDNMLKGFQDENTDPAKVHTCIVPGLASDYTVNQHCLLRFQVVPLFIVWMNVPVAV
jgi:hypothetical protein